MQEIEQTTASKSDESLSPDDYPCLRQVERLQDAYSALRPLVTKLRNTADEGRRLVTHRHAQVPGNAPGRCAVLLFHDDRVEHQNTFQSSAELCAYLEQHPPVRDSMARERRLFILEDLEPGFVDVLGNKLGVNPLIYSEQMNTWNFTDSQSNSYRSLPSVATPETLFTIRYYELRTLDHNEDPTELRSRMTSAVNRRKCEPWRDLDLPSIDADKRHGFIRRCASFWTSHESRADSWDAMVLVDPPMDSCSGCKKRRSDPCSVPLFDCSPNCLMLEDPDIYRSRKELWQSRRWDREGSVKAVRHKSSPYHGGCTTLIRPYLCYADGARRTSIIENTSRNRASLFDELIFYWTQCPEPQALEAVKQNAVNSAYYLLKYVACSWDNQPEFIAYSVANSEWFKDDHEGSMDIDSTAHDWKNELALISAASKNINYQRRKMGQFEQAMTLNLERMGMNLGVTVVNGNLPLALKDAQQDFLAIYSRLKALRVRVDDLSTIANEVAGLRAAFKSIEDGANGLKLSLFLAIIFPLTLVASMLSMGDDYLPGKKNFWVFWASSVPLALVIGGVMMFDRIHQVWNGLTGSKITKMGKASEVKFENV